MTRVDLDPVDHRPVVLQLEDGRWVFGTLEAYTGNGDWLGLVRYTCEGGEKRTVWVAAERLRL